MDYLCTQDETLHKLEVQNSIEAINKGIELGLLK